MIPELGPVVTASPGNKLSYLEVRSKGILKPVTIKSGPALDFAPQVGTGFTPRNMTKPMSPLRTKLMTNGMRHWPKRRYLRWFDESFTVKGLLQAA
jgi:hypothetical protein